MTSHEPSKSVDVGSEILVRAIGGIPTIGPGDDLAEVIETGLKTAQLELRDQDVLAIASKIVSRAQGCFVDLSTVEPSSSAQSLAEEVDKDARLVELILRESRGVSRKREGALIVRHRLGFISANAGIDASNAAPHDASADSGPWVLTLPSNPDATAEEIREALRARHGVDVGVVITDSWGRPFRTGTVGFAIGTAGFPPVLDRRGTIDRYGRELEATETATADAVAAAADLVAGQADEGRPLTLVRGLRFEPTCETSQALLRDPDTDLYA